MRRCTEKLVGALSQGVRHAGLRLVENQGEAEQSTDADFRAHGILPAIFMTSGGAGTCVLLQVYAFPGIPKAIWLTEALPAPRQRSDFKTGELVIV